MMTCLVNTLKQVFNVSFIFINTYVHHLVQVMQHLCQGVMIYKYPSLCCTFVLIPISNSTERNLLELGMWTFRPSYISVSGYYSTREVLLRQRIKSTASWALCAIGPTSWNISFILTLSGKSSIAATKRPIITGGRKLV